MLKTCTEYSDIYAAVQSYPGQLVPLVKLEKRGEAGQIWRESKDSLPRAFCARRSGEDKHSYRQSKQLHKGHRLSLPMTGVRTLHDHSTVVKNHLTNHQSSQLALRV